jgi:2-polyprenyl-6-methoxyphenol hydroxylase-like FAD-dependent oxidoreductase
MRAMPARRPVVEGALAAVAARTPGVVVRRGTKAEALASGTVAGRGVPHVSGVVTDGDEVIPADLVVDAMGRRTPTDRMLEATGARRPDEQREDLGFVYYCRQFRNNSGRLHPVANNVSHHEGVSLLLIPADADTFSWTLVVASNDRDMRRLRDVEAWERALALFPDIQALRAVATPITDIQVMSGAEDRRRSFVVDGEPVVTGLVAVGDAAVRTNPSLGRGSSIGLTQVCTLRDVLREVGPDRPAELARRFAEAIEAVVRPLYQATLEFDRHRMAEIQADIAGTPYQSDDGSWTLQRALAHLAAQDAEALRIVLHLNYNLELPEQVQIPPAVRTKIEALATISPGYPAASPTRAQMLAAIGNVDHRLDHQR